MAKLIARAPLSIGGRDYRPGDTFEGNVADVHPEGAAEPAPVPDRQAEQSTLEGKLRRIEGPRRGRPPKAATPLSDADHGGAE